MLTRAEIEDFCVGLERDGCVRAAATLQHFYTLFREREEQSAIIGKLRDALVRIANPLLEDDIDAIRIEARTAIEAAFREADRT